MKQNQDDHRELTKRRRNIRSGGTHLAPSTPSSQHRRWRSRSLRLLNQLLLPRSPLSLQNRFFNDVHFLQLSFSGNLIRRLISISEHLCGDRNLRTGNVTGRECHSHILWKVLINSRVLHRLVHHPVISEIGERV